MFPRMLNEFAPVFRLHDEMTRMVDSFFDDDAAPAARRYAAAYPAVNVWESADGSACHVEAELPGMRMDDLDVSVLGNQLTIAGERKIGAAAGADAAGQSGPGDGGSGGSGSGGGGWQGVSWLRRERGQGRFARTVALPWEIDADHVQARLHDGVLTVTLPKHESAKPRKVKLLPGT